MAKSILDYTTEQINTSVENATKVRANQPLGGTEEDLTALEVAGVNYKIPEGGSGTDPILENAKTTHGIGHKEDGREGIITWDGDTTGKTLTAYGYWIANDDTVSKIGGDYKYFDISAKGEEEPVDGGQIGRVTELSDADGFKLEQTQDVEDPVWVATVIRTAKEGVPAGFYFKPRANTDQYYSKIRWWFTETYYGLNFKYLPLSFQRAYGFSGFGFKAYESGSVTWDGDTEGRAYWWDDNTYFVQEEASTIAEVYSSDAAITVTAGGTNYQATDIQGFDNGYYVNVRGKISLWEYEFTLATIIKPGAEQYLGTFYPPGLYLCRNFGEGTDNYFVSSFSYGAWGSQKISSEFISSDSTKQDKLVSGSNIKTINSQSILESGDLEVQPTLVSGSNIKTVNNQSLLGSGNLSINVFPTTAQAGDALVYNGTSWEKQDGYGYTSSTSTKEFNPSERGNFYEYDGNYYYPTHSGDILDTPESIVNNSTIYYNGFEYSVDGYTKVSTGVTVMSAENKANPPGEVGPGDCVIYLKGVAGYDNGLYIRSDCGTLTATIPGKVYKINSKYLPTSGTTKYLHIVGIYQSAGAYTVEGEHYLSLSLSLITDSESPINSVSTLSGILNTKGYVGQGNYLPCSGFTTQMVRPDPTKDPYDVSMGVIGIFRPADTSEAKFAYAVLEDNTKTQLIYADASLKDVVQTI